MYHISQLGREFGLSRSTLLYYDRIGLLSPSARSESGYRRYGPADRVRLESICSLRRAGMDIEGIRAILATAGDDTTAVLRRRLDEIGGEIETLRTKQRLLAGMLKVQGEGGPGGTVNKEMFVAMLRAAGMDDAAMKRLHVEFERREPEAHHAFLLSLGISEKEALLIRKWSAPMENTMMMTYFYELFEKLPRQGPGCREATRRALGLVPDLPAHPEVLDIGCGSGLQTLVLAEVLKTRILAIDNHRPLLDVLDRSAREAGLDIETAELSMVEMPFAQGRFDLLWAEGSIFIIGLERGFKEFARYLKPGGCLAFTELCWFADDPPAEVKDFFAAVYPDMKTVPEIRRLAAESGYRVISDFNLPDSAWWDDYYTPMLARLQELKLENSGIAEAEEVYGRLEAEIDMFRRYAACYGYTFFVLRKEREV
jgi:DNA-binding transcriptional MerR regulator/ubiquinone/menaquinone biosynthesis C-methylase UbiE